MISSLMVLPPNYISWASADQFVINCARHIKPSFLSPAMRSQVPTELWVEAFSNLSFDTLKDVSLTNRAFCRATRPLLFTHFDFHPYTLGPDRAPLPLEDAEVARNLERLEFWTSDEIAPFVRSCDITPIGPRAAGLYGSPKGSYTWEKPYVLLHPFLERIQRFTGLWRLKAEDVHFTPMAIANLRRMSSLTHLHVDRFEITAGDPIECTAQPLALSSFAIHHHIMREDGLDHWTPLLHPEHLQELNVSCNLRVLGESTEAIQTFTHLHKLSITMNFSIMSHNLEIMSKFPNVRVLSIGGWGEVDAWPKDSGPFPLLSEYDGTHKLLPFFFSRATLTRITVSDATPDLVIRQLQGLCTPLNITALNGNFEGFDNEAFDTLISLLPRLVELRIRITLELEDGELEDNINSIATSFFDALADTPGLPLTLEHLALAWKFEYEYLETEPIVDDDQSDLLQLRDALLARCPALKSIWLDGHDFLFQWRKLSVGTCVETSVDNAYKPLSDDLRAVILNMGMNPDIPTIVKLTTVKRRTIERIFQNYRNKGTVMREHMYQELRGLEDTAGLSTTEAGRPIGSLERMSRPVECPRSLRLTGKEFQWLRKSTIPKARKARSGISLSILALIEAPSGGIDISNTGAQMLQAKTIGPRRVSVKSCNGSRQSVIVSLYNEREVERMAGKKYEGPEEFDHYLTTLRDQYMQAHPLGGWEFQKPDAHRRKRVSACQDRRDDSTFPQTVLSESPSPRSNSLDPELRQRSTPTRFQNKSGRGEERWLFCFEPLFGAKAMPTQIEFLKREFVALNCKWLWDAALHVLSFPANITEWSHFTLSEKETALGALLPLARAYPCRPDIRPPASPAYEALYKVLNRAPSWNNEPRCNLVLYKCFAGRRMWLWDSIYMAELFGALIAVIDSHDCGSEGWMSARWEVYDTFSTHLESLSYRNNRWYDGASNWLRGRMVLPGVYAVTTRQDNKSDIGRWYNALLPEQ
ncbi:hypothetical protein B0H19DRAFT_1243334 [Mycena capillaripes]|nr:hypothetical protein B0H19DRAFT_1243334 [Mycena capillaripes]